MRLADSSASSWYDCCGYSELAALFMIDSLGVKDKNTLYFLDWYIEKLVICVWPAKSFASSFICACLNPGGAMANSGPMEFHPYWYWNCLTFHFWLGRKHNNIDDFHRHNLICMSCHDLIDRLKSEQNDFGGATYCFLDANVHSVNHWLIGSLVDVQYTKVVYLFFLNKLFYW